MSKAEVIWRSLDWGSVPDWLAAVGTVGAFAATIVILGLDRRRLRRAAARELVLWTTRRFISDGEAGRRFVTLHAYNTSSGPVPVANVVSGKGAGEVVNEILTADGVGFTELAPGAKTQVEIQLKGYVDDSVLFVVFVDHLGGQWIKRVSDGRVFDSRRGRRLLP